MVGTRGGLLVEGCTYIRSHTSNTCYYNSRGGGGGGGLLSLENGTNCGPTSQELVLSRAKMATKRGAVQSLYLPKGELS